MSEDDSRARLFRSGPAGAPRGLGDSTGSRGRGTSRGRTSSRRGAKGLGTTGRGSTGLGTTRTGFGETRTQTRTTTALGASEQRRVVARRWLRRTRHRFARGTAAVAQAVTPLGWLAIALTIVSAVLGATLSWVEAWFVAIVGALLLLVALPFLIGSRAYQVRLEIDRTSVTVGGEVQLRVHIENGSARPAMPAIAELPVGPALREITVPFIGPGGIIDLPVSIPATQRGVVQVGPLTVARRDPVGLFRREVTWPEKHLVHVHPQIALLPPNSAGLVRDLEGTASRRLTDSDLSFYAVREYARGDAMKHVHWKSTAKTGELMVRQYEESQTARVAVLFDALRDEYADDEEFELAVSVAASISVQAVREGRERFVASAWTPGKMRPSIDGLEELPARDPQQLLDAWAELEAVPEGARFEALSRGLAGSRRPLSIVAIVTGSAADTTRIRRAAIAFTPDVHVLAVRCELYAEPKAQRLDPLTMFTVGAVGDLPQLMLRSAL